ncbi:MAG TPA: hypothetical protein VEI97_11355 [bacterium]|nr:hypothetical protein [bacterium]
MRLTLLALLCLTLAGTAVAAEDPGVQTINQVRVTDLAAVAAGKTPLASAAVTYHYQNMYGITDIWQIRGTQVLYKKMVHTTAFVDQARRKVVAGTGLTPLDRQVLELEYGEYDKYFEATLTPAQVQALYRALADAELPAAPARPGCGERYWEITLQVNGKVTQKFDVNAPGNPKFSEAVTALQDTLRDLHFDDISKGEYDQQFLKIDVGSGS